MSHTKVVFLYKYITSTSPPSCELSGVPFHSFAVANVVPGRLRPCCADDLVSLFLLPDPVVNPGS